MTLDTAFTPLTFTRGPAWKNRFALAPLTNTQSHADGTLSDDEFNWLTRRADGGFAMVMTCAAHVQAIGQGFPGQLGVWSDDHLAGLTRLARTLKDKGAVSSLQLHHAGIRSDKSIVPVPVGPSADEKNGARGLSTEEVVQLRDDFVIAAKRAEQAGFDGIEIHGAHGYILAQFLSAEFNQRNDSYGGSFENRSRLIIEIIDGIRAQCNEDFQLGLRLSPERFGLQLPEMIGLVGDLMAAGKIDYMDLPVWDYQKEPEDDAFKGRSLLSCFTDLPRNGVRLGAAGKIRTAEDAGAVLANGCDFVMLGRAAILHHDVANRMIADADYVPPELPVPAQHLRDEGLGEAFVTYMRGWKGFVKD
jgi:2,4-dienoyl-CoA reductase-like NADH-dependent reductase (Old Yellow Enzyme family)